MADYTWPFSDTDRHFCAEAFDEALEFNVELSVARSGKVTTLALPGARWRTVMQFPDTTVAYLQQRRQLEAFLASLRGGADRLLLWNHLTPEPLGTMRGTVTLAATVAAGASMAQITGGRAAPNLLRGSSFEIDTNADGLADGLATYSAGSVSGVAYTRPAGNGSPFAQRIFAASLGASGADRAGILYSEYVPVAPGASYTLSADVIANYDNNIRLFVYWYTAALAIISESQSVGIGPADWTRRAATGVAPPTAAFARFFVWTEGSGTARSNIQIFVDNIQFEAAAAATPYIGPPTLLRGDRVAFGGQRVMLTADATANDAGTVTLRFQPAHRTGAASGAAVTLVRPTTKYVLTSPVVQMPARGDRLPGFAVELVEDSDPRNNAPDPYFENVTLLTNFGTPEGVLNITDLSNWQGTGSLGSVAINGGATVDNTIPLFGASTFRATSILPNVDAFASAARFKRPSGESLTIEQWFRWNSLANTAPAAFLLDWLSTLGPRLYSLNIDFDSTLQFLQPAVIQAGATTGNVWHFLQMNVTGNTATLDVDGVQILSTSAPIDNDVGTNFVRIGGTTNTNGTGDEWAIGPTRITKGVSRARGSVPTAPFPTF